MKPFLIFIFILFGLSERFFAFDIGPLKLGLFDFSLICFSIYLFFKKKIFVSNLYIWFIIYFVLSNIFIYTIINSNISLTSIITVPLKFLLVGYFAKNINFSKKYIQLSVITFFIILSGLLFISDGSPFYEIKILNRNETITYLLALIYLIPNIRSKLRIVLLIVLVMASFMVQSRQLIFGLLFSSLIYGIVNFRVFIKYTPVVVIFAIIFTYLFNNFYFNNLDDYNKRRYSYSSVESSTGGDRARYFNIFWGLENSLTSPIIGQGTGSYVRLHPLEKVAHNSFITSFFENGIIGLILFLCVIFKSLPKKTNRLSFFIFFTMVFSLMFIESIGKFAIYLYFIKSSMHLKEIKYFNFIKSKKLVK